jgi:3'(2'), 5'-bisphosphate nucleotidase
LWLVDPLDGTREFVNRNGEFTINIALIHRQRPVLGVLQVPATGTVYFAAEGVGAFRQAPGHTMTPIAARADHAHPLRIVASRSHRDPKLAGFFARAGEHELLGVGSALKFAQIAEGAADVYPRIGPTSEWDTAAGQAIVEMAGGHVVGRDGHPLRYNDRDTLINPDFVCFAEPSRPWHQFL